MIVDDIFDVKYGVNLELNALKIDPSGVNFVSRTAKTNGVSTRVKKLPDVEPIPAGTISVAGGGSVMQSFLQPEPYYSGRDLFYLTPKEPMSEEILLFYCLCLRSNSWKFSYGRQANASLKTLEIPSVNYAQKFIKSFSIEKYQENLLGDFSFSKRKRTSTPNGGLVELDTLFDVYNGIASPEVTRYKSKIDDSCVPYVRPSYRQETSFDAYVSKKDVDSRYIFPPETLYVSTNGQGSHSYSYVSTFEFVPNSDVSVLIPKQEMTLSEKLFYAGCITNNRWLFSYGRKPKGEKLKKILIPDGAPKFISDDVINKVINELSSE
ncbi:MAG TPA: restriction endonuclease subunit S [Anaerolineales bacterium]|nr:restriction endonuclease subunit S [Anaerolineales bacterium]